MKRLAPVFVSLLFILQSTSPILAQTRVVTQTIMPRGIVSIPEDVRERIQNSLEEARKEREDVNERIKAKRLEMQELQEERRTELRNRITTIQDERKRAIIERIASRFESMNENWTDHANNVLERLTLILGKMEVRAERLSANREVDITGVTEAISAAEEAIATAQAVVEKQAGKVYTFEVVDEESLGTVMQTTLSELKADIRNMLDSVKEAREAVHEVLRELSAAVDKAETEEE